jgi:hypothetical protein
MEMQATPQREHEWLQRMVGEWTCEIVCSMAPGQPPETSKGTESVRPLGGLWVLAEGQGGMPGGGPVTSLMTLGYDPQRKRFTGTFVASVMTHLWVYDGALDGAERALTLETEGPSLAGDGAMAPYRDVIEFKSDDHRVLTSHVRGEDGTWQAFMTANYYRTR